MNRMLPMALRPRHSLLRGTLRRTLRASVIHQHCLFHQSFLLKWETTDPIQLKLKLAYEKILPLTPLAELQITSFDERNTPKFNITPPNPYLAKQNVSTEDLDQLILSKAYAPIDSYKEIVETNETQVPIPGSIVLYKKHGSESTNLGIVLREALSKFNKNYNKLTVLSTENSIDSVYPSNVVLHLHGVMVSEWIQLLQVLENRHDAHFYSRLELLWLINHFVKRSQEALLLLHDPKNLLDIVYAQNATSTSVVGLLLGEVMESLKIDSSLSKLNESYFDQSALILATHLVISQMYEKFIVTNAYPLLQFSNTVKGHSNSLANSPEYLLVPKNLSSSIHAFINTVKTSKIQQVDLLIQDLVSQQQSSHRKSIEDLNFYFALWEGTKFRHVIETLALQIVFPSRQISTLLTNLKCFSHLETVTAQDILAFFETIGLYTKKTDIIASLGIWGDTKSTNKVSIAKEDEFESKNSTNNGLAEQDPFKHLREAKYAPEDTIYSISTDSGSTVGVSLQKINSRNYLVNVHIPDVMTRILPNSNMFASLSLNSSKQNITKLDERHISLFDKEFLDSIQFKDQHIEEEPEFKNVADINLYPSKPIRNNPKGMLTCLTLSFKYNTYNSNPFKDLREQIKFSLDDLSNVRIKALTPELLQTALEGRKSSLPFALFRSKTPEKKSKLNNDDHHNLGFIYNVLKSHFSVRNINGAVNINLSSLPKASFFAKELEMFTGNLTSLFCKNEEVSVFSKAQSILVELENSDPNIDQVLVKHNNMLIPEFHANSFFQTLVSRDVDGNVSLPAFFIGKNYLNQERINVSKEKHTPHGLEDGLVPIMNPTSSFEELLNHFQLISTIHSIFMTKHLLRLNADEYKLTRNFSYLKGYGYNVNGALPEHVLAKHLLNIVNSQRVSLYAFSLNSKYWRLKEVEETLIKEEELQYECVITSPGDQVEDIGVLAKCFVKELNCEVDILVEEEMTIGSVLSSSKVLLLDPLRLVCVLQNDIPM